MCFKKFDAIVSKMKWCDMVMVKLSTFAFALLLAKLWSPLLSLDWYWYLALAAVFAIKPAYHMFKK